MTRQLLPEMFGVMAIATTVLVGLGMFSDVGLKTKRSFVNKRGDEANLFSNTAWVTQIVRGFILWCFAIGISLAIPLAGQLGLVSKGGVYENPSLPYVIVVLSCATNCSWV